MRGRALDSNNDLIIREGSLALVEDGAETAQSIRTRLLFYLGEWYLDTLAGVPYYTQIFIKPFNLKVAEQVIKGEILRTNGVNILTSFASTFEGNTRKWTIDFSAETTFGVIENETLNLNIGIS